ncbi:hypothetical protein MKX03_014788 [Papaver bracteatum]|nr:hypothetical protein MKX03_014788 [Papaver bracteatum]
MCGHLPSNELPLIRQFAMHRNGRITKSFKLIIEHILLALEELKSRGRIHGNLTVDNVGIIITRDGQIHAKVFGVRLDPNLTSRDDFTRFGELFEMCFQLSRLPLANYDEAQNFREKFNVGFVLPPNAVCLWALFQQNPSNLLRHPVFWDASKCMNFVLKLGGMLMWLRSVSATNPFYLQFRQVLDLNGINSWRWLMDKQTCTDITNRTYGVFYYASFNDLLRIMRHKGTHYLELDKADQATFRLPPQDFYERFRRSYRYLLIRAYEALEQNIRYCPDLPPDYFHEYLI